MCLDLFGDEHGDITFVPGPRRTGKDGGSDGAYDGRVGGQRARWKIACTIRQTLGQLEKKVDEERNSAVKAGFTGLVVMTSLDMTTTQVKDLRTRALRSVTTRGAGAKSLRHSLVLGRSALERLLVKHPWIAATYFGREFLQGFVPLSADERDLAGQPDLELVGRDAERTEVLRFLGSSESVLVVAAAGGSGKSRFLRALPSVARVDSARRSSWLRRPGVGTIEDGLRNGLPKSRALLVALDDAGRSLEDVRQLAMLATDGRANVRVVLAGRSADVEAIERVLRNVPRSTHRVLNLPDLGQSLAAQIAVLELPSLSHATADKFAKHFGPNLFLLRAAVQLVGAGESPANILEKGQLRDLVAERFIREAAVQLATLCDSGATERLLLTTALDVPIAASPVSLEHGALRESGLLRVVGKTLRFRADVEGDIVLSWLLDRPWARAVLERELISVPGAVLVRVRNLAAARGGRADDALKSICVSWLERAAGADRREARAVLTALPWCVHAARETVVRICEAYAAIQDALSTDDYGPVVVALSRSGSQTTALGLLRALRNAGVTEGTYSNYKFVGIAQEIVSPVYATVFHCHNLLDELSRWLDAPTAIGDVELIEACASKLLSPTVSWDSSEGAITTVYERAIRATTEVLGLRRSVFVLIAAMLKHADVNVRLGASHVLREHARLSGVASTEFGGAQKDEFLGVLPAIVDCLSSETEICVFDALEDGLVFRWATERPGAEKAQEALSKVRWPVLLSVFRLATKPSEFYSSITDAMTGAPEKGRWNWWVGRRGAARLTGPSVNDIETLVELLVRELPGEQGLLRVADCLRRTGQPWLLLDAWCRRDTALFERAAALASDKESESLLTRALRRQEFARPMFHIVSVVRDLVLSGAPLDAIAEVLDDAPRPHGDQVLDIASLLAARQEIDHRLFGVRHLSRAFDAPRSAALEVLEQALRDGLWSRGWSSIWALVHDGEGRAALLQRPVLRQLLLDRLAEVLSSQDWRDLGNGGWHVKELIEIVVGNDPSARLEFVKRCASDVSLWRTTFAALVSPLVRTGPTLRSLAVGIEELLDLQQGSDESWAHLVGAAVDEGCWADEALQIGCGLLASTRPTARRVGIILISELRDVPAACAALATFAECEGSLQEAARNALTHFTMPRGRWSSNVGEVPEEFVRMRGTLAEALLLADSVSARNVIGDMQSAVEKMIEDHLGRDAEFLDPR